MISQKTFAINMKKINKEMTEKDIKNRYEYYRLGYNDAINDVKKKLIGDGIQ
jgi:hypothetical protein